MAFSLEAPALTKSSPAAGQPAGTSDRTPDNVAKLATETGVLAMGELALIGTFGTAEDIGALLRTSIGRIIKVRKGETTSVGQIAGIEAGMVMLRRRGKTVRLAVPG